MHAMTGDGKGEMNVDQVDERLLRDRRTSLRGVPGLAHVLAGCQSWTFFSNDEFHAWLLDCRLGIAAMVWPGSLRKQMSVDEAGCRDTLGNVRQSESRISPRAKSPVCPGPSVRCVAVAERVVGNHLVVVSFVTPEGRKRRKIPLPVPDQPHSKMAITTAMFIRRSRALWHASGTLRVITCQIAFHRRQPPEN